MTKEEKLKLWAELTQELAKEIWALQPVIDTEVNFTKDHEYTHCHYKAQLVLHNSSGPAVEYIVDGKPGTKCWFVNGNRHRMDGPAIEFPDGGGTYWIGGKELTLAEFKKRTEPKEEAEEIPE